MLVDAEPVCRDDAVGPPADLIVGGGDDVLAVGAVPGVDPVVLAEASDPSHAVLACLAECDRGSVAEPSREVLDVTPERVHEAAVAAARAAAGDVLLEDHDVDPGVEPLEVESGPHARVAPAEDHDIGGRVTTERRRGFTGIMRRARRAATSFGRRRGEGGVHSSLISRDHDPTRSRLPVAPC